jgi:hypothetical protein
LHGAALGTYDCIQAQPHFIGAFSRNQQRAALPLYDMIQEWLPASECSRQFKHDECFAGAPLTTE